MKRIGPGHVAPAPFLVTLLVASFATAPALSQGRPQPAQPARAAPVSPVPLPDPRTQMKLVWSTITAVDHANRTGNYSVLRDLGTAGFQANNDAARLATVFATIRALDLGEALTVVPVWEFPPAITQPNVLRMRGNFPLRPNVIGFDMLFVWDRGAWRLDAIAVVPLTPAR